MESNQNICVVCGERSDQVSLHYARPLCNGCRAFFKRSVQGKVKFTECKSGKKCKVNFDSRKSCKSCRWDACVRAGVDITKVQQPKENEQALQNNSFEDSFHQQHFLLGGAFDSRAPTWESSLLPAGAMFPKSGLGYAPLISAYRPSVSSHQAVYSPRETIQAGGAVHNRIPAYDLDKCSAPISGSSILPWLWLPQPSGTQSGYQKVPWYNSFNSSYGPPTHSINDDVKENISAGQAEYRTSTPKTQQTLPAPESLPDNTRTSDSARSTDPIRISDSIRITEPNALFTTHGDGSSASPSQQYQHVPLTNSKDICSINSYNLIGQNEVGNGLSAFGSQDGLPTTKNETANSYTTGLHQNQIKFSNMYTFPYANQNTNVLDTVSPQNEITTRDNKQEGLSKNSKAFMIDALLKDKQPDIEIYSRPEVTAEMAAGLRLSGLSFMYPPEYHNRFLPPYSSSMYASPSYEHMSLTHSITELKESPIKHDTESSTFTRVNMPGEFRSAHTSDEVISRMSPPPSSPPVQSHGDAPCDGDSTEEFIDCEYASDDEIPTIGVVLSPEGTVSSERLSVDSTESCEGITPEGLPESTTSGYTTTLSYSAQSKSTDHYPDGPLPDNSVDSGIGVSSHQLSMGDNSTSDGSCNKENSSSTSSFTIRRKRPASGAALCEMALAKKQKLSAQSTVEMHRGPGYTSTPITKQAKDSNIVDNSL